MENLFYNFSSLILRPHRPHYPFQGKVIVQFSKKVKDALWGLVYLQIFTEYFNYFIV